MAREYESNVIEREKQGEIQGRSQRRSGLRERIKSPTFLSVELENEAAQPKRKRKRTPSLPVATQDADEIHLSSRSAGGKSYVQLRLLGVPNATTLQLDRSIADKIGLRKRAGKGNRSAFISPSVVGSIEIASSRVKFMSPKLFSYARRSVGLMGEKQTLLELALGEEHDKDDSHKTESIETTTTSAPSHRSWSKLGSRRRPQVVNSTAAICGTASDATSNDCESPLQALVSPPNPRPTVVASAPYIGLPNCGNSCYVATVVQSLLHLPDVSAQIAEPSQANTDTSIAKRLAHLMSHMTTLNTAFRITEEQRSYEQSGDEVPLLEELSELMLALKGKSCGFGDGREHCAAEFLRYLLKNGCGAAAAELIGGQTCTQTQCLECEHVNVTQCAFVELPVHIDPRHTSVTEATIAACGQEMLRASNKYDCSHCMSRTEARRRVSLHALAPVLTLHMIHSHGAKRSYALKPTLELSGSCLCAGKETSSSFICPHTRKGTVESPLSVSYTLVGAILHKGPKGYGVDSGHYTYALLSGGKGSTILFDDHIVRRLTAQEDDVIWSGKSESGIGGFGEPFLVFYVKSSS